MDGRNKRQLLAVEPVDLLPRLVGIGKLMIFATTSHVTHERIGALEDVTTADGWSRFRGRAHDSEVRLAAIRTIAVDRSRRIGDKAYPRIELNDEEDREIACIVGFEGLEPFDRALAPVAVAGELEPRKSMFNTMPESREVAVGDPGGLPFELARASGKPVTVELALADFRQRWSGVVPPLKVSHGFINILEPDFHLHVRGGSIGRWREGQDGRSEAFDNDGKALGFSVAPAA